MMFTLVISACLLAASCSSSCNEDGEDASTESCGCSTNREHSGEKPAQKYSKESNIDREEVSTLSTEFERTNSMKEVAGATFTMGTNNPVFVADKEGPARKLTIHGFLY